MSGKIPTMKVNLLAYYKEYDQPLLASIIESIFRGFNVDFEKYEDWMKENEKEEQQLSLKFKKIFGIAYDRNIFYKREVFKQALAPETWDLSKPYPKVKKGFEYSTSSVTLKAFRLENQIDDERLDLIIALRENLSKIEKLQ